MKKLTVRYVQGKMMHGILRYCIGIAVLVVTVAAGCSQGETGLDASQKAAMRVVREMATTAAILLDVYMDARATEILLCSTTCDQFRNALMDPEAVPETNRVLREWLKISQAYEAIVLLDKTGVCSASAPARFVDQDFSGDSAFKGAIAGTLTLSDAHKSDVLTSLDSKSKGWTVAIAVPIKVGNDAVGVLMSYLQWSRVSELTDSIQVGKTGYVYVLNRRNQVILHPFKAFYGMGLRDPGINSPELDDAVRKRRSTVRYEFKNVRTQRVDTKLAGFAYPKGYGNFPGLGWTVAAVADETELAREQVFWRRLFR